MQLVPLALHRFHWYVNELGAPLQTPGFTVSVWPCCTLPPIVGWTVFFTVNAIWKWPADS